MEVRRKQLFVPLIAIAAIGTVAPAFSEDAKFATGNMPVQQQQSPFKLGPMNTGTRDEGGGE